MSVLSNYFLLFHLCLLIFRVLFSNKESACLSCLFCEFVNGKLMHFLEKKQIISPLAFLMCPKAKPPAKRPAKDFWLGVRKGLWMSGEGAKGCWGSAFRSWAGGWLGGFSPALRARNLPNFLEGFCLRIGGGDERRSDQHCP